MLAQRLTIVVAVCIEDGSRGILGKSCWLWGVRGEGIQIGESGWLISGLSSVSIEAAFKCHEQTPHVQKDLVGREKGRPSRTGR